MTKRLGTILFVTFFLIGVNSPSVRAQDNDSLKGISTVLVLVENLPDGAKILGLTKETIQTDAELKLRLAGIHVVTTPEESFKLPGAPHVYIQVSLTDDARAAHINVDLEQNALLERNGQLVIGAATWSTGMIISNPTAQAIRDAVKDLFDRFLNAWLSVNPRR